MTLVYGFAATTAHENILVVIGHAGHLMRHHLANGDYQVMPS